MRKSEIKDISEGFSSDNLCEWIFTGIGKAEGRRGLRVRRIRSLIWYKLSLRYIRHRSGDTQYEFGYL